MQFFLLLYEISKSVTLTSRSYPGMGIMLSKTLDLYRGHPGAFREGEVLQQCQDFREKFWSKFWISLYILYIFTSPSAQDRKKSASFGRLFLRNRPLG